MSLENIEFEEVEDIEIGMNVYKLINIKNGELIINEYNGNEIDEDYNILVNYERVKINDEIKEMRIYYIKVNKYNYVFRLNQKFYNDLLRNFYDNINNLNPLYYKFNFKNNEIQYILKYYKNSNLIRLCGMNNIKEIYNIFKIKNYECFICDNNCSLNDINYNIRIDFKKGRNNYYSFIKYNLDETYNNINKNDKIENYIYINKLLNTSKTFKNSITKINNLIFYDYNTFEPFYVDEYKKAYYKFNINVILKGRKFDYNFIDDSIIYYYDENGNKQIDIDKTKNL